MASLTCTKKPQTHAKARPGGAGTALPDDAPSTPATATTVCPHGQLPPLPAATSASALPLVEAGTMVTCCGAPFARDVAYSFSQRAREQHGHPAVLWAIHCTPRAAATRATRAGT